MAYGRKTYVRKKRTFKRSPARRTTAIKNSRFRMDFRTKRSTAVVGMKNVVKDGFTNTQVYLDVPAGFYRIRVSDSKKKDVAAWLTLEKMKKQNY